MSNNPIKLVVIRATDQTRCMGIDSGDIVEALLLAHNNGAFSYLVKIHGRDCYLSADQVEPAE